MSTLLAREDTTPGATHTHTAPYTPIVPRTPGYTSPADPAVGTDPDQVLSHTVDKRAEPPEHASSTSIVEAVCINTNFADPEYMYAQPTLSDYEDYSPSFPVV
eukprot:scpid84440/ scgid8879/ 